MLQLLVADPGDAAKFVERRRAHRRDAVDGAVVEHDIGRYAARARDLGTPRLERSIQARIGGFTLAGRGGGPIPPALFFPERAVSPAGGLLAPAHPGLPPPNPPRAPPPVPPPQSF